MVANKATGRQAVNGSNINVEVGMSSGKSVEAMVAQLLVQTPALCGRDIVWQLAPRFGERAVQGQLYLPGGPRRECGYDCDDECPYTGQACDH
jgi:hypothetical protein